MADPITMAMMAATAAKTVSGIVGGVSSAQAASAQARADTGQAAIASAQADAREEQDRRQGRQQLGAQIANTAQSGIGFTQTAKDSLDQMAANTSLDALNDRYDGTLKRTSLLNDAAQQRAKAKSAWINAGLSAGGQALKAAAPYLGPHVTAPPDFSDVIGPPDLGAASSDLSDLPTSLFAG
jgi:hypothetical protein